MHSQKFSCLHCEARSALLNKLPMILSGDFNADSSKDKSKPLVEFFKSKFNLIMSNDPNESTTNNIIRFSDKCFIKKSKRLIASNIYQCYFQLLTVTKFHSDAEIHRVEDSLSKSLVKSVKPQSPPIVVVQDLGEGGGSSGAVLVP
ncbi:hypothetical protein TNCV_2888361 [Trichonephila clavipes]|nr:hypothetical protein TNCV_2888361 [Trichonephila clavipes]